MLHKKMSLTISSRPKVKEQVDQLLNADYQLLKNRQDIPSTILDCQIVKRNALIHQYIEAVQSEYNIPSPLKSKYPRSSSKTSSHKKLNLSIKSSRYLQESQLVKNSKNKKKLTITRRINSSIDQKPNPEAKSLIKTPKFGVFQSKEGIILGHEVAQISEKDFIQKRQTFYQRNSSRYLNRIDSKEKPGVTSQSKHKISSVSNLSNVATAKKNSQLYSEHQLDSSLPYRNTVKKISKEYQGQDQYSKIQQKNATSHRNPINEKIQSRSKIQASKLPKTKQSYRYCVGCQQAILQVNIKAHEKECLKFMDLSSLTNQKLYQQLKRKIKRIQQSIPKTQSQLHPHAVQHLRSKSTNLVKQSKNRRQFSPQTQGFRENYDGVMEIGKKWSFALEEINKLRWFTRIVEKLQKLLQNS